MRIRAEQDATLTAAATAADNQAVDGAQPRGQIAIRGGSVSAGQDIRLQADGGVKLSGVTETDTRNDRGNRKNDGASLETGSWNHASSEQRLAQSQLRAGRDLDIRASGDIDAKAAKLAAGRDASWTRAARSAWACSRRRTRTASATTRCIGAASAAAATVTTARPTPSTTAAI